MRVPFDRLAVVGVMALKRRAGADTCKGLKGTDIAPPIRK
jgi:hypothetical protein